MICALLATGRGDPSLLRALFSDVSLDTLVRLALVFGLDPRVVQASYLTARREAAASNGELDGLIAQTAPA